MTMFERFDPDTRERFDAASTLLQLDAGVTLLRRGEAGGDLYLLESGALDVVDPRPDPEVVLTVLSPGAVVGEVSFIDDFPRSADVRVAAPSRVRRWAREDLRRVLARDPELAAAFFEGLARVVADRLRTVHGSGFPNDRAAASLGHRGDMLESALAIAESTKAVLLEAEAILRDRPHEPVAQAAVRATLDRLELEVADLFGSVMVESEADEAARRLRRELRPWLGRAGPHQQRRLEHDEASITPDIISHILVGEARGDDPLGEAFDRWMLLRPTLRARRETDRAAMERLRALLPKDRPRRVLLLDTAAAHRVEVLREALSDAPTLLTILDPSRDLLNDISARWPTERGQVRLATAQVALPRLATRPSPALVGQDAVLVLGVLNQVPHRLVSRWLSSFRALLTAEGRIMVTGLGESVDHAFLDRVLGWPTIRRSAADLTALAVRADLDVEEIVEAPGPGYLHISRPSSAPKQGGRPPPLQGDRAPR